MATIGLDSLYYAKITETDEMETYDTPQKLAKAITAELAIELVEAELYADDGASEIVKEFKNGTITLGVDDIGIDKAAALIGARVDNNNVLVASSEDNSLPVAIGFRAKKSNGTYRYFWLYRVKFGVPETNLETKGDSITFQTPSIEGTVMRRNKPDNDNKHPWKAEVNEGDTGVPPTIIQDWFTAVYEPDFSTGGVT